MINISELENLDVTISRERNISLLLQILGDINNLFNTDLKNCMKVVEKKILDIEDYYLCPVDSREVYEKLSTVFKTQGEIKKAQEYYHRIAKMDSDLFEFKGKLHNFFGNNKKSMEYYQKAFEYWPENEAAQKGFKRAENRVMKSKKQLEKLKVKVNTCNDAKSYIKLGQALADIGRIEDALSTYTKALTVESGNEEAMARKGTALESLNRFDEAIELFKKALEINPKYMIAKRGINYAEYYFNHPDSEYYED